MRVIIPESSRKSEDQLEDSVISKRHDCLPCRLVSGVGVLGMGEFTLIFVFFL